MVAKKKPKANKKSYILCNVFGKPYKDKLCKFPCGKTPCKIFNLTESQKRAFEHELNEGY